LFSGKSLERTSKIKNPFKNFYLYYLKSVGIILNIFLTFTGINWLNEVTSIFLARKHLGFSYKNKNVYTLAKRKKMARAKKRPE